MKDIFQKKKLLKNPENCPKLLLRLLDCSIFPHNFLQVRLLFNMAEIPTLWPGPEHGPGHSSLVPFTRAGGEKPNRPINAPFVWLLGNWPCIFSPVPLNHSGRQTADFWALYFLPLTFLHPPPPLWPPECEMKKWCIFSNV